jgi:hypothetical protein
MDPGPRPGGSRDVIGRLECNLVWKVLHSEPVVYVDDEKVASLVYDGSLIPTRLLHAPTTTLSKLNELLASLSAVPLRLQRFYPSSNPSATNFVRRLPRCYCPLLFLRRAAEFAVLP